MASSQPDLVQLLQSIDANASLAERHLWLIRLLQWVRGSEGDANASVARVRLFLDAAQAHPQWHDRWRVWWQKFMGTVDATPLLADFGFAPRTAFLSEFGHRLRRKMLPGTPETTDLADLFGLLFSGRHDARWLRALDAATLDRLHRDLFSGQARDPAAEGDTRPLRLTFGQDVLMDALMFSVSQVSATGFASEIRTRMSDSARAARAFHALPAQFETFRQAVTHSGPHSTAALTAATALREQLDACRHAAYTVYGHLEEHGVSVGIVFRLRQLRERVVRVKDLLDCLQSQQPAHTTVLLLARLVQVGQEGRSLRNLVASSSHLTAAKVAERSAETGEHYITRNAAEYQDMLRKAAGGGTVIAFTTWIKFALYALGLSAFWGGFAAGLNYAASFILVQLLHWTVATKQPAVTAPAMAAKLKDVEAPEAVESFVDEVAHLFRSQIAAIIGNLGLVVPVVLATGLLMQLAIGHPVLDAAHARQVLSDLHLLGPTVLFAAFTGVLLFASSIVAGWVENWFVFYRLDSAMAHNPGFTAALGRDRALRWARFTRANISGFASNASLGMMLGLVPAFAAFFGLGLEVRHVTLSAGQISAAVVSLGVEVFREPGLWWAVASIAAIGPLNLGVSFYLAFRLALAAHNVTDVDRARIRTALRARWRTDLRSFFLPR